LNSTGEELKTILTREQANNSALRGELDQEKALRLSENQQSLTQLQDAESKLHQEVGSREQAISKLKKDYANLGKDKADADEKITKLQRTVESITQTKDNLESSLQHLQQEMDKATDRLAFLESEKSNLIKTALAAQEDQRKLRQITEKFESKLENFVKLIYGDSSFTTMLKDCSKYSSVKKQGGKKESKWQKRFLILNGNFLLYYANTDDKDPKGVIRLDNELVVTSKCDLSKIKIEHAFTIVKKDKSTRAFFFSCTTEEECTDWVKVILRAQGWPTEEINAYLGADIESKGSERNSAILPKTAKESKK